MPQQKRLRKFLFISLALHLFVITTVVVLMSRSGPSPLPTVLPVKIVDLPPELLSKTPIPAPPVPERRIRPSSPIPPPEKFGTAPEAGSPRKKSGPGTPQGTGQRDKGGGKGLPGVPEGTGPRVEEDRKGRPGEGGPLPFLSQNDIDELARKGMPDKKPGDDSVTLDTDEFKFISYNRWLKIKVESVLKYPELAAISGYQGTLYIKFDIMRDGSLSGLEILKSSGYKILDDEALRSIQASAPFQPLPNEWHLERYAIRAAVIFYLGQGYIR